MHSGRHGFLRNGGRGLSDAHLDRACDDRYRASCFDGFFVAGPGCSHRRRRHGRGGSVGARSGRHPLGCRSRYRTASAIASEPLEEAVVRHACGLDCHLTINPLWSSLGRRRCAHAFAPGETLRNGCERPRASTRASSASSETPESLVVFGATIVATSSSKSI